MSAQADRSEKITLNVIENIKIITNNLLINNFRPKTKICNI